MISAAAALALRAEWDGVVRMRERMQTLVCVTFASGAITGPALAKVVYNLPLLLAFDVLRQALLTARDEGQFKCRRGQLGDLMDSEVGGQVLSCAFRWKNQMSYDTPAHFEFYNDARGRGASAQNKM